MKKLLPFLLALCCLMFCAFAVVVIGENTGILVE